MLLSSPNKSNPLFWRLAAVSIANAANCAIRSQAAPSPCLRLGDGSGAAAGIPRDAPPGFPGGAVRACPAVCLSVCPCPCLGGCPAAAPRFEVGSSSPSALPGRARWDPDKHNLVCERDDLSSCLLFFFFFLFSAPFPSPDEKPPVPGVPQTMELMCWCRRS